ncbi:MAG TPA: protein kinase, partial [Pyrinomonadaceae bacterium]|nr:protein kinase [Pyrinomonadaceae bacterium]
ETLRARMRRGGMTLREALDVAVQVADALAAAHAAGIAHRDVKPENIMLRRDGYVKVLDFGLAKLTEQRGDVVDTQAPTLAHVETDPGTVMGTMQYMSPEQARGVSVDARTDIFSLGVVLYEMVAGRAPFEGETRSDLLVSLLSQEPQPLSSLVDEVPAELERIVRKALRKSRDERYQTIKDMSLDLKSLRRELEVGAELERSLAPGGTRSGKFSTASARITASTALDSTERTEQGLQQRTSAILPVAVVKRRRYLFAVVALLLMAGAAFGLYKFFGASKVKGQAAEIFHNVKMVKLTNNGNIKTAAISPDGKYIIYAMDEGGKQSLWLRQVTVASNVRLIPLADISYIGLEFSPDSNFIYYAAFNGHDAAAIYKIPVIGGPPTKVAGDVRTFISISPDGKQLATARLRPEAEEADLIITNLDGSNEQKLITHKYQEIFGWANWSRDGKRLVYPLLQSDSTGFNNVIAVLDIASRTERIVSTRKWPAMSVVKWLADDSGFVMLANDGENPMAQVWKVSYPDGNAQKITNDLSEYRDLSITDDGSVLVATQVQKVSTIWIITKGDASHAQQITPGLGTYYDIAVTPGGKLLYSSDVSGGSDIWEMDADGKNQKQLTAGAGRNYAPMPSRDGRYIVFHSNRSGGIWQIWRMDADGGNPKQLTFHSSESNWPQVSMDNRWVYYVHAEPNQSQTLWRVPIDGGQPAQITQEFSMRPSLSPDGKYIACWQEERIDAQHSRVVITILSAPDARVVKKLDIPPNTSIGWDKGIRWTEDSQSVSFIVEMGGASNVSTLPISGGKPVQMTNFRESTMFAFDWLPGGQLVTSRGLNTSDVVMLTDNPR